MTRSRDRFTICVIRRKPIHLLLASLALAAMVAIGLLQISTAQGAVKRVRVVDDRFAPTRITIKRGDTVRWNFARGNRNFHNVTATRTPRGVAKRRYRSARAVGPGERFSRSFRRAGIYRFSCTLHFGMNMRVAVRR